MFGTASHSACGCPRGLCDCPSPESETRAEEITRQLGYMSDTFHTMEKKVADAENNYRKLKNKFDDKVNKEVNKETSRIEKVLKKRHKELMAKQVQINAYAKKLRPRFEKALALNKGTISKQNIWELLELMMESDDTRWLISVLQKWVDEDHSDEGRS